MSDFKKIKKLKKEFEYFKEQESSLSNSEKKTILKSLLADVNELLRSDLSKESKAEINSLLLIL